MCNESPGEVRRPEVEYRSGAVFRGYRPRLGLDRFVELIWTVRGVPSVRAERVLPNGVVELIVNLGPPHEVRDRGRRTTFRRAWMAGLQRGPLDIGMLGDESILVGVRFRPGGAHPILGLPLTAITDAVVELEGREAATVLDVRERMFDVESDGDRVALVERALVGLLSRRGAPDARVGRALGALTRPLHGGEPAEGRRIDEVSRLAGVSRKHLVDLFRRHVGVTPKMLTRILRFQRVIAAVDTDVRAGHASGWADLAYANGYADQAHLCRDFKALSGITPTEYRAARTVDPNHVELPVTSSRRRGSSPSA